MSCSCRCAGDAEECISVLPSEACLELLDDADTTFEFILTDGDCEPIDITSDSVRLTVRDYIGGTIKLQKTNAPGSHSDPANGKTQFTILNTDITGLTDKRTEWVFEIRRIQPGDIETVHIQGDFIVHRAVGD